MCLVPCRLRFLHLVLCAAILVLGRQSKIAAFEGGLYCQLAVKLHRRGAFRLGLRGDPSVNVQPPKRSVISECDWASVVLPLDSSRGSSANWKLQRRVGVLVSHLACGDGTTHFGSSFLVGNLRHLGACEASTVRPASADGILDYELVMLNGGSFSPHQVKSYCLERASRTAVIADFRFPGSEWMGTVVHRRTPRMRETQMQLPSGLPYAGFVAMSPMSLQQQQLGSAKTKHILSRYRPIAPKPVAGLSADQTTTDTHSASTLSTENASTTEYKPSKRSRKRPPDSSVTKAEKKKPQMQKAKPEDAIPAPAAELRGYDLTPLLPVGVARKFGPGGWKRFHDSFDSRDVSVSLSLSAGTPSPREAVALGLHVGVARDDVGFMERAAARLEFSENEVSVSRLFQPRESPFCKAGPSLSTSFGTDSEVCSAEDSDKSDVVTLSLLPDTPSNVNARASSSSSALSTLSLLRPDAQWATPTWETLPAATSSDLNTNLTMSSTGLWLEMSPVAPVHSTFAVVDARDLEQRHGASSEAVLLTDAWGQILWANAAFYRLSNERTSSRAQAIGPHIDPLGIRTQLASLAFQPPFPALKVKAVLWGFLKKFILQERMEDVHL